MRILLLTAGTRGDVEPFAALARCAVPQATRSACGPGTFRRGRVRHRHRQSAHGLRPVHQRAGRFAQGHGHNIQDHDPARRGQAAVRRFVYARFGSMKAADALARGRIVLAAARRSGLDVLAATGVGRPGNPRGGVSGVESVAHGGDPPRRVRHSPRGRRRGHPVSRGPFHRRPAVLWDRAAPPRPGTGADTVPETHHRRAHRRPRPGRRTGKSLRRGRRPRYSPARGVFQSGGPLRSRVAQGADVPGSDHKIGFCPGRHDGIQGRPQTVQVLSHGCRGLLSHASHRSSARSVPEGDTPGSAGKGRPRRDSGRVWGCS